MSITVLYQSLVPDNPQNEVNVRFKDMDDSKSVYFGKASFFFKHEIYDSIPLLEDKAMFCGKLGFHCFNI
jgi:hypothetical protein